MVFSDRIWERTVAMTRFGHSSTDALLTGLAASHFAMERLGPRMGDNVPDDTPRAITTRMLDTGLGALVRARI